MVRKSNVSAGVLAIWTLSITPGLAQIASDDWDYGEDPARKLSIAAVTFDSFGVAVRCLDGSLSVVMSGLPTSSGQRTITYGLGEDAPAPSEWISSRNSNSAFAIWPRYVGSRLKRGGRLSVSVPDGAGVRRYAVDLPTSEEAVDRVFRACGEDMEQPDTEAPPSGPVFTGFRWDTPPTVSFPSRTMSSAGLAAVTCSVKAQGWLERCRIESEFPEGSGFGRAATFAAHRTARVAPLSGTYPDGEGRRISFIVRYTADDLIF